MSGIYTQFFMGLLKMKAALKGEKYIGIFNELKKEQWYSPDQIENLQTQRLKKLLKHAYDGSKYYSAKFDGLWDVIENIKSTEDLQKFPLLTRDNLQNSHGDLMSPIAGVNVFPNSSGGSTGNPVSLYQDSIYKDYTDAFELLFLSWFGLSRGDKTAIFWGAVKDFPELPFKARTMLKLERQRHLNSFHVDEAGMMTFLEELNQFQPEYIYGYASSMDLAADYLLKNDHLKIKPIAVRATAEVLYPSQKEKIEAAFNAPVYNFYGSREVNNLAAECPAREGMHLFASGRIVEVIDESGKWVAPGEMGYLAVTDLTNHSYPIIRYLIGDMGIREDKQCSCGRGYPMIKNITGRTFEIMNFNGKFIHGHFFANQFLGHPDVKQFQIIQETLNLLVIKIVASNRELDLEPILNRIRDNVGEGVTIDVKIVDEIPPLSSGKYRYTINKLAPKSE